MKVLYSFVFLMFMLTINAQTNWVTPEKADSIQQADSTLVMVKFYAQWCGPCKLMQQNTFNDATVSSYINEHFIAINYDVESKEEVTFQGKKYSFNPDRGRNGVNGFVEAFLKKLDYPSIVFINYKGEVVKTLVGYHTPDEFLEELKQL